MSKILVVANWKMNPAKPGEARQLFDLLFKENKGDCEVVVCPPFVWLPFFKKKNNLFLGGQNCHWENSGAFTGEISAKMLAGLKAEYVILGHSERRNFFGETNQMVNFKVKAALKNRLKPIICVGEREGEEMSFVMEDQLNLCLDGLNQNQMKEVIIAYEPVWAVGTGNACLPDNALSAGVFIKKTLIKKIPRFLADKIPILYGGSVTSANAAEYIKVSRLDGLLVGGASLDAEEFVKIIKSL